MDSVLIDFTYQSLKTVLTIEYIILGGLGPWSMIITYWQEV